MEVCALVPVYNEGAHLDDVVRGCRKHVNSVLVVDDGSTDGSGDIARAAGAMVLCHPSNRGKGAALKTGFSWIVKQAAWDGAIVVDGDGQHNCDEIPNFISCLREGGYAIVLGNRMTDLRSMPLERRATNWLSSRVISAITGQHIPDSQCGFRLITVDVLKHLVLKTGRFDTDSEMLIEAARKGYTIGSVPIPTIYGRERSHIHPALDTLRFMRISLKYFFRRKRGRRRAGPSRR
jgi:glycosyltransferase involved in cell wall biosynthesis